MSYACAAQSALHRTNACSMKFYEWDLTFSPDPVNQICTAILPKMASVFCLFCAPAQFDPMVKLYSEQPLEGCYKYGNTKGRNEDPT